MPPDTTPACPRCGYDLSGVVSTWRESCPLEGVCSECGLAIRWGELCGAVATPPWWYVEAAPGRLFRRWLLTWVRHLLPSLLWRRLNLRMELRPGRLAAFAILGIAVSHLLVMGTVVGLMAWEYGLYVRQIRVRPPGTPVRGFLEGMPWHLIAWPYEIMGVNLAETATTFAIPVSIGLLMPALCYLFSDTLRLEPVRLLHLLRIATLWLPSSVLSGAIVLSTVCVAEWHQRSAWATWIAWSVLPAGFVLFALWPLAYWWRAMGLYLRMRRALLAAIILSISSWIIAIALLALVAMLASE